MANRNSTMQSTAGPGLLSPPEWPGKTIQASDMLPGGAQVDPAGFTAYTSPVTVTVTGNSSVTVTLTADADEADTSITVTALTGAVPSGTVLNFGGGLSATTTANASLGATSISVSALDAAIPTGAAAVYSVTGGAAAGATTIPVTALTAGLPAGLALNFGEGRAAFLTQAASSGATSLNVSPLAQAIPGGATAEFLGRPGKFIPSGTLVSRTYAQRAAGDPFHAAVYTEDEFFLIAFDVIDATKNNDVALVKGKNGFPVKENFLPGWNGLSADLKAVIREQFVTTVGV